MLGKDERGRQVGSGRGRERFVQHSFALSAPVDPEAVMGSIPSYRAVVLFRTSTVLDVDGGTNIDDDDEG